MAAELGLVSLTQLQQLLQSAVHHPQPDTGSSTSTITSTSRMWNPNPSPQKPGRALLEEEDDSWEVRAFAEDTGNIMGTTWPPRSYTCTFCRREFRSAQALGGHMNVHRRDRARLHQTQYPPGVLPSRFPQTPSSTLPPPPAPLVISNQNLVAQGGLCLLYQLPNPGSFFGEGTINNNAHLDRSLAASPLASSSAYYNQPNVSSNNDSPHHSEAETDSSSFEGSKTMSGNDMRKDSGAELDLELRLGPRPTHFLFKREQTSIDTKQSFLSITHQ